MKRQYLQSLPKATDIRNQAYNFYNKNVQILFVSIQQKYDREGCQFLLEQIKKLNDVRSIKKIHKKPIYEFFLKRELSTLNYLKGAKNVDFEIMKLTKCKIQGFKIQWKQIWQKILKDVPEASTSSSKSIETFIKHIKQFFDENNAIEVWQYFQNQNYKNMQKLLSVFARVTPQTKQQIFNDFVSLIIGKQKIKQLKETQFISLFFWLQKSRKQICLSKEVFQFVNDLVLQIILGNKQTGSKRTSFQNNFHSYTAQILQKIIGKANPGSLKLLEIIFSYIKKFIKPLQNSTKSVMFVHWFFKFLFQRVQIQKKTRLRLSKLIQKIQKKQNYQQEQPQTKAQQLPQKKQQQKQNKDEKQQNNKTKQKQENQQNQEEDEDFQQEQEENEEDQLQQAALGQNYKVHFEKDDQNQKPDTDEQKRQKMQKLLANQISQQILVYLQKQVQQIFQIIYFVNSKKTISYLLRYIYRLFPKFALTSLDVINKASNIPNINQDGLIKNLITTVEHMFMSQNYVEGVRNVMKVLQKAFNSRRIVDVWRIYQSVQSKIPLLEQKDLQAIPDSDKQLFQKIFGLNHDRFYTQYSDHMVEAIKKLLKEGQFIEKNEYKAFSATMQQTVFNSYPHMKKTILAEAMQIVQQNPNFLVLLYFNYADVPQKEFKILKTQFSSMNEQNRDTLQLRLQFLNSLSKNMTLQQLKPYIRKYAQKGEFHIVQQYAYHKISQQINWKPHKTTLNYLYQDPKITIQLKNSSEKIRNCLKQLMAYRDELIEQAIVQIDKVTEDDHDNISERIIKSYTTPAKISTLAQRKKIYQILSLVNNINLLMQQKILNIKNHKKLQLIISQVSPYGFLDINKPFSKYIKKILNCQQVLHDPKLISTINTLLTNQYFMYFDMQMNCDKLLQKQRKRNKNHQATGCVNLAIYGSQYIASAKGYMAHLLHKTNGGINHDIKGKADQLFLLSMINSNQSYKDIRSMFQQAQLIGSYRKYLINLMSQKAQNRQLIKRISSTIDFLTKKQVSYLIYTDEQILQFIAYHATLMQSYDSKIKQNALKSFRKFNKIIQQNPISDNLTQAMLKYRNTEKMELIWIIYIAALINNPQFVQDNAIAQKRILEILKNLQGLLLHETRSTRRISIYLYPALIRILKKINCKYQTVSYTSDKLQQKTLQEFIQKGFLRTQFYDKDLKNKAIQKKHHHKNYNLKNIYTLPQNLFDFLINNPQNALKFVKRFHSDLASTTQMMISAMQSAANNIDLFSIASKAIQSLIYFFKTKDMSVSRSQIFVGAKFFKYLCMQDAKVAYKFHQVVKDFVLQCLVNMQSLDNQTLVILYSYSLMNAYETTFSKRIPHIESFLTTVLKQIINKSSKLIYSKLQALFFKKIKNRQAIKFVIELCQKMIQDKKKVYRAGYLLAIVNGNNYFTSQKILMKMLDQKLEIQHQNNIANFFNFILNYPQNTIWNVSQIEETQVIDLKKLKQQKQVQLINGKYLIFSNKKIHNYLIRSIKQMLEGQSVQMAKTGFTILNNAIKSSSYLYISQENADFIVQLLNLQLEMFVQKKQLQIDFQLGNKTIGYLLASELLPTFAFQKFLFSILEKSEPSKKFCGLLIQILNSPINFLKISHELAEKFALKILDFEYNSAIYKYLLKILSTFLIYRVDVFKSLNEKETENKNRRVLLLQSYLMAQNAKLNREFVKQVLKTSQKDRKNLWARQMLLVRGQRQYFDDEETYQIWRQIKQLSNPYFYHA